MAGGADNLANNQFCVRASDAEDPGWPPATRTLIWRAHGNNPRVRAFISLATDPPPKPSFKPGWADWRGPQLDHDRPAR
jgi:hypothetical protein